MSPTYTSSKHSRFVARKHSLWQLNDRSGVKYGSVMLRGLRLRWLRVFGGVCVHVLLLQGALRLSVAMTFEFVTWEQRDLLARLGESMESSDKAVAQTRFALFSNTTSNLHTTTDLHLVAHALEEWWLSDYSRGVGASYSIQCLGFKISTERNGVIKESKQQKKNCDHARLNV